MSRLFVRISRIALEAICMVLKNNYKEVQSMNINKIADLPSYNQNTAPKSKEVEASQKQNTTIASDNNDKFVRSELAHTPAYTKNIKNKYEDVGEVRNTINYANEQINNFKRLVHSMLGKQNEGKETTAFELLDIPSSEMLDIISGTGLVDGVDESGFDDPWSSTNVAKRIIDFARAISNSDKSNISTLKKAFQRGFSAAESVYGGKGKLADVSYETYDMVMAAFDEWEKE